MSKLYVFFWYRFAIVRTTMPSNAIHIEADKSIKVGVMSAVRRAMQLSISDKSSINATMSTSNINAMP